MWLYFGIVSPSPILYEDDDAESNHMIPDGSYDHVILKPSTWSETTDRQSGNQVTCCHVIISGLGRAGETSLDQPNNCNLTKSNKMPPFCLNINFSFNNYTSVTYILYE